MKVLENIEKFNRNIGIIGAWIVLPLNAVVIYEVLIRYVFNNPTDWVYDVAWMLFSAIFLLGGAYTMIEKRHVRIDIIFNALPKKAQLWYDIFFFAIIMIPVLALLTFKGYQFAAMAWNSGETLSTTLWVFPAWPSKILMPIGFGMLCIQGFIELQKNLKAVLGKGDGNGS